MDGIGVEVDGLKESYRFLGKVDKALKKEAVLILKEHTVRIKAEAQAKMNTGPGTRGGRKMTKGAIIHRASATKGASVGINRGSKSKRNAQIFPAEFGTFTGMIPSGPDNSESKSHPQHSFRRRSFPIWRGNQFVSRGRSGPGWIVQPTIRRNMDRFSKDLTESLEDVFDRAAKKAGLQRGT